MDKIILDYWIINKTKDICDNDVSASLTTIADRLASSLAKELELPKNITIMIIERKADEVREGIRLHNLNR